MEDAGFVGGGCWLEEVGLGCTVASAPAEEVVVFSAPEYPPVRDQERKR